MPFARSRVAVCVSLAAALCACSIAQARDLHLELGLGMARFNPHGDGSWYQQALPYRLQLQSAALMLGVTGALTPRTEWHLDLFDLGHAASDSWDVMDVNYDPIHHVCLRHCEQLTHFIGSGSRWGVAPMLGIHTEGPARWLVEAGPWLFHQSWRADVPNFFSSTGMPPSAGSGLWSRRGDAISHAASDWGMGVAGGIGLRWHNYQALLLGFYNNKNFGLGSDPWPPLWRSEFALFVGHVF